MIIYGLFFARLIVLLSHVIVMKEQTIKIKENRLGVFEDAVLVNEQNGNLGVLSTDVFDPTAKHRSTVVRYVGSLRSRLKELVPSIAGLQAEIRPKRSPAGDSAITDLQATLAELLSRNNELAIENQQLRNTLAEKELQIELLQLQANLLKEY